MNNLAWMRRMHEAAGVLEAENLSIGSLLGSRHGKGVRYAYDRTWNVLPQENILNTRVSSYKKLTHFLLYWSDYLECALQSCLNFSKLWTRWISLRRCCKWGFCFHRLYVRLYSAGIISVSISNRVRTVRVIQYIYTQYYNLNHQVFLWILLTSSLSTC